MLLNLPVLCIFLYIGLSVCEKFPYDNYCLYRVLPKNAVQTKFLKELKNENKFEFWGAPTNPDYVTILSSPEHKSYLESYLNTHDMRFEITIPNIQEAIEKQSVNRYTRGDVKSMGFESYYDLESIYTWIDDLVATYPSVASVIKGGTSYEGRDIKGIKISHGKGRRVIFIEGGIHAREWIGPAVVNYIINELMTSDDEEIRTIAREFDWHIFPVLNPDGYVWTHTEFRLWRKSRRPFVTPNGIEYGVDLNRNWDNNWMVVGASNDPKSLNYAGEGPFSEPESRTLAKYIESIGDKIDLYLSFHSSGQLLLLPFGNTTEPLANYDDAIKIGRRAMGALSVRFGTQYKAGNVAEAIYYASGASIDWVKEKFNVPLVYCYELRDRGFYGHLLPADQILPSGQETMDSILELIHQARRMGYMNSDITT